MNVALLQLGIFGVLGVGCLVGYVVESSRTRASNVMRSGAAAGVVRTFRAPVGEDWVALGFGEGRATADPATDPASVEIVSSGFELRDDDGHPWLVPQGTKLIVRAVEGTRRTPTHVDDATGFALEVAPGTTLYARAPAATPGDGERSVRVLAGLGVPLVLAGKPAAASGQAFAGCWLMILFPFVVGGALAAAFGAEPLGWVAIGLATVLVVIGVNAMPSR